MTKDYQVKFQDRDQEVEFLRMALGMHGFRFEYHDVDLVYQTIKELNKKGGSMNLKDVTEVRNAWEIRWKNYFKGHNVTIKKE